jgi:ribosomal protein L24E
MGLSPFRKMPNMKHESLQRHGHMARKTDGQLFTNLSMKCESLFKIYAIVPEDFSHSHMHAEGCPFNFE